MSTITEVEVQKRNKKRVNIYLDGEFSFACSAELVYTNGLKKGKNIDESFIEEVVRQDNYLKCKNDALKYIESKFKTESEVVKKLYEKGYDKDTINKVIIFMKEYNFIDDLEYARLYVKEKAKKEGKNKIKYGLIAKGISNEIIESVLSHNIEEGDELKIARELAVKKYTSVIKSENDRNKIYRKLSDFLIRKGYSYDIVSSIVKDIVKGEEY